MASVILMARSILNLIGMNGILALDCNCFSVVFLRSSKDLLKIEVIYKLSFSLYGYLILTVLKVQYTIYSLCTFSLTLASIKNWV